MSSTQRPRGNRFGCFAYGCGFALVLITVVGGGLGYYFISSLRSAFLKYSSEGAPVIRSEDVDPLVKNAARQKLGAFSIAVNGQSDFSIDLSSEELGALISEAGWGDKIEAKLSGNSLQARFAFPLTALGEWPAARFLLGSAVSRSFHGGFVADASVRDGVASVKFNELTLNGYQLEDMARGHASQWVSGAINAQVSEASEEGSPGEFSLSNVKALDIRDSRLYVELSPKKIAKPSESD